METENNERMSAHAYTPGLEIKSSKRVIKTRRLPIKGKVIVNVDDKIDFDSVVAETEVPGDPYVVPVSDELSVRAEDCEEFFCIPIGTTVSKGEQIAKRSQLFGLLKYECLSPVNGTLESYSDYTGKAIVREKNKVLQINAYIPGRVVKVLENEGVIIETHAAYFQGIFGVGGEKHGELLTLAESRDEILTPDKLDPSHKGKIIAGHAFVTGETLRKAQDIGVNGIIVGGIDLFELNDFLNYTIGVAITGLEDINFILILTEGFGNMPMSKKTFDLLKRFSHSEAAINGTTHIRAGVIRPEIIIPYQPRVQPEEALYEDLSIGMRPGTKIKIIRQPYFGEIGIIDELIIETQKVETESMVRVVRIELENGLKVIVPRANVEIIQE
jgi:hypothetical protein